MTPSLRARNVASIRDSEIRGGRTDKCRVRPLARPRQRAATEPFSLPPGGREFKSRRPIAIFRSPSSC